MDLNIKNFGHENIVTKLNGIFSNLEKNIRTEIETRLNIKTRNSKITFVDSMIHKIKCAFIGETKQKTTNDFNMDNNNEISRISFYDKENKISLSIYTKLCTEIRNLYIELVNNPTLIILGDGTYTNTNVQNKKGVLETSLNLGLFDATNDVPYALTFEGEEKKNNELGCFKSYILKNNIDKNVIFVLDRAYCSYEFIDFLINNNYRFVIRFRNNCKNFNKIMLFLVLEYLNTLIH